MRHLWQDKKSDGTLEPARLTNTRTTTQQRWITVVTNNRNTAQVQTHHGTRVAAGTAEQDFSGALVFLFDDVFLCSRVEYEREDA